MQLSTAIFMGRHTIERPIPGCIDACAIPMALNSIGVKMDFSSSETVWMCYRAMGEHWPWLNKMEGNSFPFCESGGFNTHFGAGSSVCGLVPHVFDFHVSEGQITLEQMCDFIRSIEPPEDTDPADEQPEITLKQHIDFEMRLNREGKDLGGYPDPVEERFA
jgi:hypothetical protein